MSERRPEDTVPEDTMREDTEPESSRIGTREDRATLFAYIVAATLRREAHSPAKRVLFDLDIARDMGRYRDEMIEADSETALYYALCKISNARRDRHLSIEPVAGGITFPPSDHAPDGRAGADDHPMLVAPVRLATDFAQRSAPRVFLADVPTRFVQMVPGQSPPARGAWLTIINGTPVAAYVEAVTPYHRYSTPAAFWFHLPTEIVKRSALLPERFYGATLDLGFEGEDGVVKTLTLPYVPSESLVWTIESPPSPQRQPADFTFHHGVQTYDLYVHDTRPILLLAWKGFGSDLIADMDRLMETAATAGWLDHDIVFDGTRAGGGDFGGYALSRLTPQPYKGTFGNLRISDVTERLAYGLLAEDAARIAAGDVHPEVAREVAYRREWIATDLTLAIQAGKRYSNAVPFKSVHLPKWADGIIDPAAVHFRGRMVCLFSPFGGSHMDQFAANVIDNRLARTIGMPEGGYSKTWIWGETLYFASTRQPVIRFNWCCGSTIRPNGEVLESNPGEVDEFIPPTRENHSDYHNRLIARALRILEYPS